MINISPEDAKLFEQNGFTKDKVRATVQHYREQGFSDEDIQTKMNDKISSFKIPQPEEEKSLNDQYKQFGQDRLNARIEWEKNHPIVSRLQADYQPNYRADRTAMEEAAKYGFQVPVGEALKNSAVRLGQTLVPYINAGRDAYLATLSGGGNVLGRIGLGIGTGALQGASSEALDELSNNGLSMDVLSRGLEGGALGGTTGGILSGGIEGLNVARGGLKNLFENPNVQNAITKGLDVLTSVPQKFSQRAIDAELAGNSILSGKFNPDVAYRPIEQKLTKAKGLLPDAASFGNEYYKLGQKAVQGMENLEEKAAADIAAALEPLNNQEIQNGGLQNAVNTIINSFGEGGIYNSAKARAKNVINFLNENLNKEGLTLRDLHRIKEDLYDIGYSEAGQKNGVGAKVARGVANQINNYLRRVSPSYAKPNDVYSVIKDVTRGLDSENTIGSKLKNIGSTNSALSGLDQRLKAVDNLLPQNERFYKQAADLVNTENEVNNIINTIGKQYERNPRLLSNRTDEAFEQALGDLQNRTGVNFMDDLNNVRAREALESLTSGQGGGYGSAQGSANRIRGGITTALAGLGGVTGGLQGAIVAPLISTAMFSPKIMAKGTIKNLGKVYRNLQEPISEGVQRLINPLAERLASPLLYGGVEYNNY